MYQPSTACVDKEGWLEAASLTKTLVPGGARGVALKSKFLLMAAWAERLGFVREDQRRLRVIAAWGMRLSHSWEGKLGSQDASPAQRWYLNVRIARTEALRQWVYRGTSWKLTLYLRKAFCMVWEHSLSRMWRMGDAPCCCRCLWHVVQATVISRAYRFLISWAWMELMS